jgi:hypothetical protein
MSKIEKYRTARKRFIDCGKNFKSGRGVKLQSKEKVLYKHVSKWIPHRVRNNRIEIDSIRGQISPLRFAPVEMTPWGGMAVDMTFLSQAAMSIVQVHGGT